MKYKRFFILIGIIILTFIFTVKNVWAGKKHKYKIMEEGIDIVPPKNLKNIAQFFGYLDQRMFPCVAHIMLGGALMNGLFMNGDKWMCLDGTLKTDPCVVVSFGVNNEWSFEDAIAALKCTVFAFDPTMSMGDHKHSRNVFFRNLGLSNTKGIVSINNMTCMVDRYENILKDLGLLSKEITYLKMDIEGFEMNFLHDVFKSNPTLLERVNQIAMEIHLDTYEENEEGKNNLDGRFAEYWMHFQKMEQLGFRLAHMEINKNSSVKYMLEGVLRSTWYELVWINIKHLK